MKVDSKILKVYQSLLNKFGYSSCQVIEDVYTCGQSGIDTYYESVSEFYANDCAKEGYKKLHTSNEEVQRALNFASWFIESTLSYRRDNMHVAIFFIKDTKNNDWIPCITVFGRKCGLLGSFIIYRSSEDKMYIRVLASFQSKRKELGKFINWVFK